MLRKRRKKGPPALGRPFRRAPRVHGSVCEDCHRLRFEPLEGRLLLDAGAVVSEFMASNGTTLFDGDNESSDWIEIYNPTAGPVDLVGWHLSDDPDDTTMWEFPNAPQSDVTLNPGEYLVVMASGKGDDPRYAGATGYYVDSKGYLHTSFKLDADGDGDESVILADDVGTIVHGYIDYPPQITDVSYGFFIGATWNTLVDARAPVGYHVPQSGDAPLLPTPGDPGWTASGFNDASWSHSRIFGAADVLITEVNTGDAEFVEIQNASTGPIDLTGWTVLVNDGISGNVNALHGAAWSLSGTLAPGQVSYWENDIPWEVGGPGWAMIIDAAGKVEDFLAWGYSAAQIASLSIDYAAFTGITPTGQWSGEGVDVTSGIPGPQEDAIAFGASWDYMHPTNAVDPAGSDADFNATWMQPAGYDGPPFAGSGPAVLGYGTIDLRSVTTNIGQPSGGSRYTAYFRKDDFTLDNDMINVGIEILSDDGAVIYIDGAEVARNNFNGADVYTAFADGYTYSNGENTERVTRTIPIADLSAGTHTIAVSLHQANTGSSDLGFDLRLFGLPLSMAATVLKRWGDSDGNTAEDVLRDDQSSKGVANSEMSVPFGVVVSHLTGVGFSDEQPGFEDLIQTPLDEAMLDVNASIWLRMEFEAQDLSDFRSLMLNVKYDDGFVAYLNGTQVTSRRAPGALAYNSAASSSHPDWQAVEFEQIDVTAHLGLLQAGTNVLAIHGLNVDAGDADFLILPQLTAEADMSPPRYFSNATPGADNDPSLGAPADTVAFSRPGGLFTEADLTVALSTESANAVIHYTTNGQLPTQASTVYTAPLSINSTTQVRAVAYETGRAAGFVSSESYLKLAGDALSFSSDLPIVVVETFGGGVPGRSSGFGNAYFAIFEPGPNGRTRLTDPLVVDTRGGIHIRGSSSAGFAKKQYRVEFWDEANGDRRLEILGMPSEADWIFYGPGQYDRVLISNPLMFDLSNQIDRYAVRTRWVEMYINNSGSLSSADYWGVHAIMEVIERGDDRVDVGALSDGSGGPVEGGFVWKNDRGSAYVDPDNPNSAQRSYIDGYISSLQNAATGTNFKDPNIGYAAYADVGAFVDHNLLNMLAMNVDAMRLSGFYYKTSDGKLEAGPIWDFDRSLDSTDGRDNNPSRWFGTGDSTRYFDDGSRVRLWWPRMFQDPDFVQKYIDRWFELRDAEFSLANIYATIDAHAAELQEAAPRDYARWYNPRYGNFNGEIQHLKDWLTQRINWVDSQWLAGPAANVAGPVVAPGTRVSLSSPAGGTIYYTLDGSDPRGTGGSVAGQQYTGTSIRINDYTKITARVYVANHGPTNQGYIASGDDWSAPLVAEYFIHPLAAADNLVITELNYNPYDPPGGSAYTSDDFEFIELLNAGAQTIALGGATFVDGIDFQFPGHTTLAPGQRIVVVANQAAFQSRYGPGINVAGEYAAEPGGKRLSNTGERIELEGFLQTTIRDFRFNDSGDWPGRADGKGAALEAIDPGGDYDDPDNWRSSTEYGGSPGIAGIGPVVDVVVNEVLTHTDPPSLDAIELYNTSAGPVDVAGWYLSDSWGWESDPFNGNYKKYRIPVLDLGQQGKTLLQPGEYIVFDEDDFNVSRGVAPTDFALDGAHGEDVWLMRGDASGKLTQFADHVEFPAAANGESLGRWPNGSGDLYPMVGVTLSGANSGPRVGPVIVSELMYHPGIFHESFDGGTADRFTVARGSWTVTDGSYHARPALLGRDTVATLDLTGPLAADYELKADVNAAAPAGGYRSNAALIFDYAGSTSFKFARMVADDGEWQIGRRVGSSTWSVYASATGLIEANTDYRIKLRVEGSTATLLVDGIEMVAFDFGEPLNDGLLGIGTNNSISSFDEVGYGPAAADDLEFIELYNPTVEDINLAQWLDNPQQPGTQYLADWRLRKGVDMEFDENTILPSGGMLVVLSFEPAKPENAARVARFRTYYGIDTSVALSGGYGGKLSNGGERIRLQSPDEPRLDEPSFVPHYLEDEVDYDDVAPWPAEADGNGLSLHRLGADLWGHDPASWEAQTPSPGQVDLVVEAQVAGRYAFYHNSAFSGDAAIAPTPQQLLDGGKDPKWGKQALLPGETASFQNYTTYSRGLNGIVVDIADLPAATTQLTTDDFEFRVGNSSDLGTWSDPAATPAPQNIALDTSGAGPARATITWADNDIRNQWLQATVKATAATGLADDDVFYFGNTSGEVGNVFGGADPDALVTYADLIQTRNNIGLTTEVTIENGFDFNRDKFVTYSDLILCRNNINLTSGLELITAPLGAAPPEAVGEGTVYDVALEALFADAEPVATESGTTPRRMRPGVSLAELTWLRDYERLIASNRPATRSSSAAEAVDRLLATGLTRE